MRCCTACASVQCKRLLFSVTSCQPGLVQCRLTVQDPEFWKGLQPVTFGPLPRLQSQVTVIGYPCAQPCWPQYP